jgi:hypothetical protein
MGTALLAVHEETINSLNQVASTLGESAEALANKAINQYLRQVAERKIEREETHYLAQHPQLLANYAGQYIAMHQGQVIDVDSDELALFLRIRQRYPMVGILIKHVTEAAEEIWTIRSPRMEYS